MVVSSPQRLKSRPKKSRKSKSKSRTRMSRKSKSKTRKTRKSRKSKFGSSPKASSPKFKAVSPKMTNLPTELLSLIYNKMPNLDDRVALASTSKQMRGAVSYENANHIIHTPSDIDIAVKNRATHITIKNKSLVLSVFQALPNMTHLVMRTLGLENLPKLPTRLKYLDCRSNRLSSLPALPLTLNYLNCTNNLHVTALPALPPVLNELHCKSCSLMKLPAMPRGLRILDCSDNKIRVLPEMPATLQKLYCNSNKLTALPKLPSTIQIVHADNNLKKFVICN